VKPLKYDCKASLVAGGAVSSTFFLVFFAACAPFCLGFATAAFLASAFGGGSDADRLPSFSFFATAFGGSAFFFFFFHCC
jgi:hypothetical protein